MLGHGLRGAMEFDAKASLLLHLIPSCRELPLWDIFFSHISFIRCFGTAAESGILRNGQNRRSGRESEPLRRPRHCSYMRSGTGTFVNSIEVCSSLEFGT